MMHIALLPEGTENLSKIFDIDFSKVEEYFIQAIDEEGGIVATSGRNRNECCFDLRIHFQNSFGQLDALNFREAGIEIDSKSGVWERAKSPTYDIGNGGRFRTDIQTETVYFVETPFYTDEEIPFLVEFISSPLHFLEWKISGTDEKDYLPVLISESKIQRGDDFMNQLATKVILSNPRINHR